LATIETPMTAPSMMPNSATENAVAIPATSAPVMSPLTAPAIASLTTARRPVASET